MVFSAMPLTMMASAATVTAAGYTFDWIRGSDGANDFNEVITPVGEALTTKDYNDNTCMTTSRNLEVGDKFVYTTKDDVAEGMYRVVFEVRGHTGRADLNIKINDRDYGNFVSPTSGSSNQKVILFTDFVQAETAPVTIEFVVTKAGNMYIEQLHFEKVEYEYTVDGTNATLTKYIGTGGDIEIPEKIDGYTVVGVGADCFKGCETLTSIKAYKNVASIGEGAFADCVGLEKITIDNGACEIFDSAETISETAVISGGNKSTAQAYAEKYGREFEMITFATIGDEPFSSLEEAFAAAEDGDRIVLVKDYDLTSSITTDTAVVLDLAGYTLKAPTATITTTADFEIASTEDGLGKVYSGAEVIEPSTDADKIGTIADVSNINLYVKGQYPSSGNATIAEYDNRIALNKLIAVKYGKKYTVDANLAFSTNGKFVIREYKADGTLVKSVGAVENGSTYTPSSADVECVGLTIYRTDSTTYDILGDMKNGHINPIFDMVVVKGQINFGSAFVKTSANFKMSNIKATASATGSFYEQTDAAATPKFEVKDCAFALSSGIYPLAFNKNPVNIDMQDSTVSLGINNNNAGFSIASASVGTFKNVKFSMKQGYAVSVSKTGSEGITFDGCTITQETYDQGAVLNMSGGNVTLTGNTKVDGANRAGNVLSVSGGKLTLDGVTVTGDKGDANTKRAVYIKNNPTLIIKNANFVKSSKGTVTNDAAKLRAGLAEGVVFYKASKVSRAAILSKEADIVNQSVYARACEHYCSSSQQSGEEKNICSYCGLEAEISHDYSTVEYNETQHWGTCATCGYQQEPVDHEVGENGKAATCTEPAVCGGCNQNFGEALGHSFTKYEVVSSAEAGCEHNPVTVAYCDNGCGEYKYDYSALVNLEVSQEAVAPTCTQEGSTQEQVCVTCKKIIEYSEIIPANGHTFGETEVVEDSNYAYTGKGKHTCIVEGCGFSEEVVIPKKAFKPATVAILNANYDEPVEFNTIKEAIAAAQDGDVIILVKNATLEGKVELDKEIILDLAGYKLTASTDSATFETNKNLELRSTVLGLGEKYSGSEGVPPSSEEDKYGTLGDVPNKALYVKGHYATNGTFGSYENRIALNKLIAVDEGVEHIMKTGSSNAKLKFIIREYKADASFLKSAGGFADGAKYTSSIGAAYISISFYIDGNSSTDILAMLESGSLTPSIEVTGIKGTVSFAKPFVKTSAQFKMSNIKAVATAKASFFESTATDVATPAKLITKDCTFAVSNSVYPLAFDNGVTEIDMQDSTVSLGTDNQKAGFVINSDSFGTFKNVKFAMSTGFAVNVYKTGEAGITFDKCTMTSSGDAGNCALVITGCIVNLVGGCSIGNNSAGYNTKISGGTVTIDGATFNDAKNPAVGVLNITGGTLVIKSMAVKNSGLLTNDATKIKEGLAEGCVFYSSSKPAPDAILSKDASITSLKELYVGPCVHYCIANQQEIDNVNLCSYCGAEEAEISHNYKKESFKYNETQHWGTCETCGYQQQPTDHAVGENGVAASCTAPAVCGDCGQNFGEALGHSFTKYQEIPAIYEEGCEHNPAVVADCDNGCGAEKYDYSYLKNLKVTKEAVAPTCTTRGRTAEQSCSICDKVIIYDEVIQALGHTFGETEVEVAPTYITKGKGKHTCETCGFSEKVVIPTVAFKPATTVILNANYETPVEFNTIQEAIAAAQDGDVIILVKDATLDGKVELDKEIIIDLNGYKLKTSTDSASFVTSKNLELRSTLNGFGEKYSGIVDVEPSAEDDEFGTIGDIPNKALYVAGHYSTAGNFEANTNRIALNKLIAVEYGRSYVMKTGSSNASLEFVIREFKANGALNKSIGAVADGATYTPSENTAYIGVAFWTRDDTATDIMAMMQNDEFVPTMTYTAVKGTVSFAKPFVQTSAEFKMSNIKASATAATTFFASSAEDVAAPAKLIAKDCQFTSDGTAQPLKFTSNATELDIQNSSIYSTTGNGFEVNSVGVFGTLKNVTISKGSNAISVSKTAEAGIVFDGCNIYSSNYEATSATISGGTVTFTGDTSISGSNAASTVLYISGGNVTLDGVTISGDKGADNGRKLIAFSNTPTVIIKKAAFVRGTSNGAAGVITNNLETLKSSLAEGSTFFSSTTMDANSVIKADSIKVTDKAVYVGPCGHWERSVSKAETCTKPHTCNFCAMAFEPLGHDYSAYDFDEATHWRICARCDEVDPENNEPEAHFGGQATCDEPAECEACGEYHGKALGHLFPEANADGSYDKEHYAFDEDNHWVSCTREGCDFAKEGTIVAHNGGTATCEEKAVCKDCGQEYGIELGHSYIKYVSNNDATCNADGTETALCDNGCGKSASRVDEGSKLGHKWVVSYGYDATCKDKGLTNGSYCENCNFVREEQEEIPVKPNAHIWDAGFVKQEGDCSTDSIYVYTCQHCKTSQEYNFGKVDSKHDFESIYVTDTPATFQKQGSKSKHCKRCDAKQSEQATPVLTFSATKVKNGIELKWGAYEAQGVHYEVERKVNNGAFILIQNYLTTPYCLDTTATVNATYVYRVTIVCGDVKSTSKEAKVVIDSSATSTTKLKLKAPKFKVKAVKGKKQFKVTYKKVKGATGFQVRYRIKGKWKIKTFKAKKNVTKLIKKLKAGKYKVQVRAMIKKGKQKAYSKWAKAKRVTVK